MWSGEDTLSEKMEVNAQEEKELTVQCVDFSEDTKLYSAKIRHNWKLQLITVHLQDKKCEAGGQTLVSVNR